jgi:phage regulator Rha-like protein
MNNLILTQNKPLTMSTREIASLLNKTHSNIKISAERLAEKGTIALQGSNFEHNGNQYNEWLLNKRDSLILVAQNSPEFTAAIVDRWQELESRHQPKIPTNFAEALQLAADQAKQLELAAPKVEFVDRFVERESLQNATQVASSLGMKSAIALNKVLDEIGGVYNGAVKRSRIFTAKFISDGYGEVKQNDSGYPQSLFTTKGVTRIHEILVSEGYL